MVIGVEKKRSLLDGPNDIHLCCVVLQSKLPMELLQSAVTDFWPQNPLFSLLLPFSLSLLSLFASSRLFAHFAFRFSPSPSSI